MKASRLTRLIEDDEAIQWLEYERFGYNDRDEISLKYLGLTDRWIDIPAKKAYFASALVHTQIIEDHKQKLEAIQKYIPSDGISIVYKQQDMAKLTNNMFASQRVLLAIRARIQEFATRIYYEQVFSGQAETIFSQYQNDVDGLLAVTAKTAFQRLPQAFERLGAGDPEAISHALTTCRRVIDSFADAVYPPRAEPANIGGQQIDVGAPHTRNRLRVFVYERTGAGSRYDRLRKALTSLYDRVSAGVHADVTIGEARALVLHTYLLLGEILSL